MSNEAKSSQNPEQPQYKRPEFILIDDREEKSRYSYFNPHSPEPQSFSHTEEQERDYSRLRGAISLRILFFLGIILCVIVGFGILIGSVVVTFLAACSLFKNPSLNQGVRHFWKIYMHAVMTGLGCALGVISPTLGLSSIILYFSLSVGKGDHFLNKIFQKSFN